MVLRTWIYIRNNGNGSPTAVFCRSESLAESIAEGWTDKYGHERFPDDIYYDTIELDDNEEVLLPDYLSNEYD